MTNRLLILVLMLCPGCAFMTPQSAEDLEWRLGQVEETLEVAIPVIEAAKAHHDPCEVEEVRAVVAAVIADVNNVRQSINDANYVSTEDVADQIAAAVPVVAAIEQRFPQLMGLSVLLAGLAGVLRIWKRK